VVSLQQTRYTIYVYTYNATLQCVRVTIVSMHIRSLVIAVGVDVAVNNIKVLWDAMEVQQSVPVELQNVILYNK
jgi:hypothetical protein